LAVYTQTHVSHNIRLLTYQKTCNVLKLPKKSYKRQLRVLRWENHITECALRKEVYSEPIEFLLSYSRTSSHGLPNLMHVDRAKYLPTFHLFPPGRTFVDPYYFYLVIHSLRSERKRIPFFFSFSSLSPLLPSSFCIERLGKL